MDFEAARRNADDRLTQELTRIRNLPKRSKIKIGNKYGLKHASHTNAGLLKSLEIDLNVISREQRRVANECNKRQREFTEVQRKSLSKFLPSIAQEDGGEGKSTVQGKTQRQRKTTTVIDQTPMWLKGRKESICELKREMLLDMTARSKEKTYEIISKNNKKTSIGAPLPPIRDIEVEVDREALITRLNRQRKNAFAGSCFPFLLAENQEYNREGVKYPRKKPYQDQREPSLPSNYAQDNEQDDFRKRTYRETVYEKILEIPDPSKIPHLDPRDPKLYHVVMKARKRKVSKLEQADHVVARKNTVSTRHWK